MPEYHNIQAYLSLEHRSHRAAALELASILDAHGLQTEQSRAWIETVARELTSQDGYPPHGPTISTTFGGVAVEVDPMVSLWTPDVIPALRWSWIEVGFLVESQRIEIYQPDEPRFRPEMEPVLLGLAMLLAPIARDAPAFLTNELTDGVPWEAYVGDEGDPWAFDLAVANEDLGWPHDLPEAFARTTFRGVTVIARRNAWRSLPWTVSS